jgi:hypothetical protein
MQIGDIKIIETIVDLEHRMNVLEEFLQHVLNNNKSLNLPKQADIEKFRNNSIKKLNKKYPNMGIEKK